MSVLLSKARAEHCRAVVCEAVEPPSIRGDAFGRARICGVPVSFPTSYCAAHRQRLYDPATITRAPIDLAVVRQAPAPDLQPLLTEIFG